MSVVAVVEQVPPGCLSPATMPARPRATTRPPPRMSSSSARSASRRSQVAVSSAPPVSLPPGVQTVQHPFGLAGVLQRRRLVAQQHARPRCPAPPPAPGAASGRPRAGAGRRRARLQPEAVRHRHRRARRPSASSPPTVPATNWSSGSWGSSAVGTCRGESAAGQEGQQRGLARPVGAGNRDPAARPQVEVQVRQQRRLAPGPALRERPAAQVEERGAVSRHGAAFARRRGARSRGHLVAGRRARVILPPQPRPAAPSGPRRLRPRTDGAGMRKRRGSRGSSA